MKRILITFLTGVMAATGLMVPGVVSAATNNSSSSVSRTVQAMRPTQGSGIYAALGDSIAAGSGLASDGGDARCERSTQAYGYKVAQSRNLSLIHVACGGATAGDLVTGQGVTGRNIGPQLDTAFAHGTPSLVTITAGANDMLWGDFLRKCASSTCGTSFDTATTDTLRAAYKIKLDFVFSEIQRRSNGQPPTVVVTGYSNPISNYCKTRQQMVSPAEINWLNSQRDLLNKSIREVAARYSFVKYASMNFDSHSLCSPATWWQGLNDPAPLHPNDAGQQAIANSINRTLGSR